VHKLIKFLYHGLKESPVGTQKIRELTNYIHDVCSDLGFIIFALSVFTKI